LHMTPHAAGSTFLAASYTALHSGLPHITNAKRSGNVRRSA
jgi:hypothetical protein